jgi:hypothetical protein
MYVCVCMYYLYVCISVHFEAFLLSLSYITYRPPMHSIEGCAFSRLQLEQGPEAGRASPATIVSVEMSPTLPILFKIIYSSSPPTQVVLTMHLVLEFNHIHSFSQSVRMGPFFEKNELAFLDPSKSHTQHKH